MIKAVFLDRDGVINESHTERVKFINKPEDLYLLPGVADAIAMLRSKGYMIFVVTNQGGVDRGYGNRYPSG
jgi:D-glycero-D-manno-heptose 1,7-bisphosphate phosphatase